MLVRPIFKFESMVRFPLGTCPGEEGGKLDIDMLRVIANLTHIGQPYLLLPKNIVSGMVDGRLIGGGVMRSLARETRLHVNGMNIISKYTY